MERIVADFEAMRGMESRILELITDIEQQLQELDHQLRYVGPVWEGAAHSGFADTFARWRHAADDLTQRLKELRRIVSTSRGNYQSALAANVRMWGGRR